MTISSKWLDFPAMAASDTAAADIVPYGDMSEPVGTRQRIATLETLRSYLTADAHVAEVDPVVTDDETGGFAIGRLWFNKAVGSEALFIALDVTTGAAVWEDVFALAGVDGDVVGPASAVDARIVTFDGTTGKLVQDSGSTVADLKTEVIQVACSDETTDLTTGAAKVTFRMPFAMTLTTVRASVTTAPTGSVLTVDINEGGTSILSTKLTIDAGEKTSVAAATAAVISDASLADDAEVTIDIDQVGSTVAGAGLKITLIGTRA